ncbi:unnamed protein product [Tuber aestivum]|uniref:Uncharacterized protein n=1 Tax=Tuber aestivum TaxID=59557 RepID=A0A292PUI5_9PEZI|nr:unnamed protein product [Tuber aestivum]
MPKEVVIHHQLILGMDEHTILSPNVSIANERFVTASKGNQPDLYWALPLCRGGGSERSTRTISNLPSPQARSSKQDGTGTFSAQRPRNHKPGIHSDRGQPEAWGAPSQKPPSLPSLSTRRRGPRAVWLCLLEYTRSQSPLVFPKSFSASYPLTHS